MFTSKRLLLLLALPLIASQALAGHPRLPYRACVAVLDANGAGQMTCALRQCVEDDSRANPDLNAFAQACSPRNPTRCLSLRVVPGCGGEKALLMHDFAKLKLKPGQHLPAVAGDYHCRAFRQGGHSLRVECDGPRHIVVNLQRAESAPPAEDVTVGSSPNCDDLWNWCYGTTQTDPEACRDYAGYCSSPE